MWTRHEDAETGGSIAAYATNDAAPKILFWQMVFQNISLFFPGSDDFPMAAKMVGGTGN